MSRKKKEQSNQVTTNPDEKKDENLQPTISTETMDKAIEKATIVISTHSKSPKNKEPEAKSDQKPILHPIFVFKK